ncbi:MAG: Mrp/NBP35 family ATP-binding protein, partial [Oscillospiraceae bacterium]|nr:Mrp/NBP35 family ATP-binding protein [Oscillospiraceae bacterium]
QGKTQAAAEAHGLRLLARMPIDPNLAQLTDQGRIEDFQGQWLAPVVEEIL